MIGHRLMLNLHPRPAATDGAVAPGNDESHARHAIMAAFLSLLLFCVLLAVLSPARACAVTTLLVLLFAISACLAPSRGVVAAAARGDGTRRPAPAVRLVVRRCTCGLTDAAIGALPTFMYGSHVAAAAGNGGGDEQRGGCAAPQLLCAVCLEDVRDGDTVRQLPPCRHLFHVDCIDLWLRTRRTCPLCRCELSPREVTAKAAAAAATEPSAHALPLPPV